METMVNGNHIFVTNGLNVNRSRIILPPPFFVAHVPRLKRCWIGDDSHPIFNATKSIKNVILFIVVLYTVSKLVDPRKFYLD